MCSVWDFSGIFGGDDDDGGGDGGGADDGGGSGDADGGGGGKIGDDDASESPQSRVLFGLSTSFGLLTNEASIAGSGWGARAAATAGAPGCSWRVASARARGLHCNLDKVGFSLPNLCQLDGHIPC